MDDLAEYMSYVDNFPRIDSIIVNRRNVDFQQYVPSATVPIDARHEETYWSWNYDDDIEMAEIWTHYYFINEAAGLEWRGHVGYLHRHIVHVDDIRSEYNGHTRPGVDILTSTRNDYDRWLNDVGLFVYSWSKASALPPDLFRKVKEVYLLCEYDYETYPLECWDVEYGFGFGIRRSRRIRENNRRR